MPFPLPGSNFPTAFFHPSEESNAFSARLRSARSANSSATARGIRRGKAAQCVPSILRDGVGGAIFPPVDSAQEMAAWIKENYLDRQRYEALANRARDDYEQRLSSIANGTQQAEIIRTRIDVNAVPARHKMLLTAVDFNVIGRDRLEPSAEHMASNNAESSGVR
jgi:hypothetical protein